MPDISEAKIGILDAEDLIPAGRVAYEAVRHYTIDGRGNEFSRSGKSPAAVLLGQVVTDYPAMEPPLPREVVQTIADFSGQYQEYVFGEGYGRDDSERKRLEHVADQLISVVFEYGYGNLLPSVAK